MKADIILRPHGDDEQWFAEHRERVTRIREPVGFECRAEFQTLGMHQKNRERILIWRAPQEANDNGPIKLLKIPFLLFADETVENEDHILLPIIDEIMKDAAKKHGMKVTR